VKRPALDADGYPTEESLEYLAAHIPRDPCEPLAYVVEAWSTYGTVRLDGSTLRLTTGGWSGNESLIEALELQHVAWPAAWESTHRGGAYCFDLARFSDGGAAVREAVARRW